jgi:hypothetical protein
MSPLHPDLLHVGRDLVDAAGSLFGGIALFGELRLELGVLDISISVLSDLGGITLLLFNRGGH